MCSRTFGGSVVTKSDLKSSIANYITNATEKMRGEGSLCTKVSVFASTNRFKEGEQFHLYNDASLANPTNDTRKLVKKAFELIDESYREGFEYKKAGARLSGFRSSTEFQVDFLAPKDSENDQALMKAIDLINKIQGDGSVKLGACGVDDKAWKMKRDYKSPRYLSCWNELKEFS